MEINRAKEIVSALAEGIDPTTGELLPENSVYNKSDVIRALYTVLRACDDKKPRQTQKKEPDNYDEVLYERLKKVRNRIADEKRVPSFKILPNYPLMHMADQKPITIASFLNIHGVGKYTAKHYGSIFIEEIKDYLESINNNA